MDKIKAEEIVKKLVNKSISRFRQDVEGENEELIDRTLRQFRSRLSRRIWKNAQQWCKWDENGPVLMPDHTRIYYRKGSTEVVLQEFPPQVRLLKFRGDLFNKTESTQFLNEEERKSVRHFSLALPYVIFMFKFTSGNFVEVRCAFSDRPLKRLQEQPLRPFLSNIDSNLVVCLGLSFDRAGLETGNLTQQIALVLNHFWSSVFTDEWSAHFWNTRTQLNDPRLASFEAWQNATEENPLFVIEDVKWLPHQEEQFGDIFVRMLEDDQKNVVLLENLYETLIEEFFKDVQKSYIENLNSINISDSFVSSLTEELMAELGDK